MWPSTPAERRHLAWRCRTCCLRRFRASRPPQNSSFRGSIPHPTRSLCTLRIRRRRRLRNTRFPAVRYRLTGAGLSPAGSRQLRLTHRYQKFESTSLQRRVSCELSPRGAIAGIPRSTASRSDWLGRPSTGRSELKSSTGARVSGPRRPVLGPLMHAEFTGYASRSPAAHTDTLAMGDPANGAAAMMELAVESLVYLAAIAGRWPLKLPYIGQTPRIQDRSRGVGEDQQMDDIIEKSAMRKIYLRLLPFAILSYFLAYIDRINVSFAALTMRDDLGISAGAYGFALGTFYWGYFIFEVPSNVIMEKVGARIWIARIMITWGILAGLTALVTGSTSFGIVRFLLGVAEAGFFPGLVLYFTYWFPTYHHARIVSGFLIGFSIAGVCGGRR